MLGPVLIGERVRLAPPPPNFAEIVLSWFEDPEIQRFVIPYPYTLEEEREFLERVARDPNTIFWAIWTGEDPIGTTAINEIVWRHRHAGTGSMIGRSEFRGQGLGTEAHRLRSRYAFEELGMESLMSSARADNAKSIEALRRVGYRDAGLLRRSIYGQGEWHDRWIGQLLREDWERTGRPYPRTIGMVSDGSMRSEDAEEYMREHWKPE